MLRPRLAEAIALIAVTLALAGSAQAQTGELGRIDFPTSGFPEAQGHFLRGVLWLHSFEYADARSEFQKAQQLAPGFAMAYWGEAMTYNHPLWSEQDREAALAALQRLAPTPDARLAQAPTEREKGYLRAVEILYGEGDKPGRDRAYAEVMRRLAAQYPDDLEAASFSALATLGSVAERDFATYMRAAAIAEEVFAKNPQHPGAVHYLIHSYDDPIHAPLGLQAARVYAKIAPAATHAQHMPSHIFLALGMWEDVVASNEASWESSLKHGGRSYHALHWLEYAYLQQGRYRDARKLLAIIEQDAHQQGGAGAAWYLAAMRAAYIVETRGWQEETTEGSVEATGVRDIAGPAADWFARGLAAAKAGNREAAEEALAKLKALRTTAAAGEAGGHSHQPWYMQVSPAGLKAASVMEQQLEGALLLAQGQSERGLALLREAAAAEDSMSFDFGPPAVVKPTRELLGEALLDLDQAKPAQQQFELALARAPGRALSLLGLARAAARAGDEETARRSYAELRKIWAHADTELPDLAEVRLAAARAQ